LEGMFGARRRDPAQGSVGKRGGTLAGWLLSAIALLIAVPPHAESFPSPTDPPMPHRLCMQRSSPVSTWRRSNLRTEKALATYMATMIPSRSGARMEARVGAREAGVAIHVEAPEDMSFVGPSFDLKFSVHLPSHSPYLPSRGKGCYWGRQGGVRRGLGPWPRDLPSHEVG